MKHATAVASLLVAASWPSSAAAQPRRPSTSSAAVPAKASVFASTPPTPTGAEIANPVATEPDVTTQAREHFAEGTRLMKVENFGAAVLQFERAYELKPNFKVWYSIGQAQLKNHAYVEARDALMRYLQEGTGQVDAERRAAAIVDLAEIERHLALLVLTVNVAGANVLIDGNKVGRTPLASAVSVSEGERTLNVEAPGRRGLTRRLRFAAGTSQALTLNFEPSARATTPPPAGLSSLNSAPAARARTGPAFWATAIAAAAFGAGAGITGYFAFQAQDDNRRERKNFGTSRDELGDSDRRAGHLALASDLLGVAALASGGAAVWLWATSPPPERAARVSVSVGLGTAALNASF